MENSLAPASAAVKDAACFYALSVPFMEGCDSWQRQDLFSSRSAFPYYFSYLFSDSHTPFSTPALVARLVVRVS